MLNSSSTIESITIEKYYSEEVSRVQPNIILGSYYSDISYK